MFLIKWYLFWPKPLLPLSFVIATLLLITSCVFCLFLFLSELLPLQPLPLTQTPWLCIPWISPRSLRQIPPKTPCFPSLDWILSKSSWTNPNAVSLPCDTRPLDDQTAVPDLGITRAQGISPSSRRPSYTFPCSHSPCLESSVTVTEFKFCGNIIKCFAKYYWIHEHFNLCAIHKCTCFAKQCAINDQFNLYAIHMLITCSIEQCFTG